MRTRRPIRGVICVEAVGLAAAGAVAVWLAPDANWDLPLFAVLLVASVIGDLTARDTAAARIKISSSFLAIVTATVLLGGTPGALIGTVTILAGWLRFRYTGTALLNNLFTFAWFPIASGTAFHATLDAAGIDSGDGLFYLLVFGTFMLALAINFVLVVGERSYVERDPLWNKVRRVLVPLLPTELVSGLIAVGLAYLYVKVGLASLALFAIALLVLQYLMGALLLSQERADELEVRAKQLAGFQVGLLSALLRTLDLRDRMTARHSAAVARYSREIAAAAGMSEEEQEVAHTAGLLHDIGKFILSDKILSGEADLTEADWVEIRKHPYEGARIVSEIDGYRPVGEIILAHHERVDGLGYPRGLQGEEIPEIARIIAVADTYDVLTARDSYRQPMNSFDALAELRRSAGTQLDPEYVEILAALLAGRDFSYRHGEDADFDAELALDARIDEHATAGATCAPRLAAKA
jgi:putative nucleotidyltransferase with HDIG domain